jgi:hypothetical protein
MPGQDVHDMSYYSKCMVGGILSCGLTHAVMCPLDIVKCRKQVRISQSGLLFPLKIQKESSFLAKLLNLLYRPTPSCTRALEMVSALSTELRDSEASLL